jgi:hypothetical protein
MPYTRKIARKMTAAEKTRLGLLNNDDRAMNADGEQNGNADEGKGLIVGNVSRPTSHRRCFAAHDH